MVRPVLRFLVSLLLAVAALVLTAGVVLWFKPDWQRQLLESALESRTDLAWQIESAHLAGWNHFEGRGVFGLAGGTGFSAGEVDLFFDWGRSLGPDGLVVSQGEIAAFSLDLENVSGARLPLPHPAVANTVLGREATLLAVQTMAGWAFAELAASGMVAEVRDLGVEGVVLLPEGRQLRFDLVYLLGQAGAPEAVRVEVRAAELR
ncbi:MAG: hypothetical protein ACLFU2_08755 [Opitutales bacterium]